MEKFKIIIGGLVNVRLRTGMAVGRVVAYHPEGDFYDVKVGDCTKLFVFTGKDLDAWN